MLKGDALIYYFTNQSVIASKNMDGIITIFRTHFEGREYCVNLQNEWNRINLQTYINDHKDKTLLECLDIMTDRLRMFTIGLDAGLSADAQIYNKLTTACEGMPAFELVSQKPSTDLEGLTSDLRGAASRYDRLRSSGQALASETFFTDRKFHKQCRYDKRQDKRHHRSEWRPKCNQHHKQPRQQRPHSTKRRHPGYPDKTCDICGKTHCWSTNHTREEQQKLYG